MRKLYRFYTVHPLSIPLFSSPIIPLIVMVIGSIVRDQNGQLNWWKRDHQEGREEGVCIYQTWMIFIHWRLQEYIMALEDTWRSLSVGLQLSLDVPFDCIAWLGIYRYQLTSACSTCTSVEKKDLTVCPLSDNLHLILLHLPVWGMCSHTLSHIIKGDLTVVSPSGFWHVVIHIFLRVLSIKL